MCDSTSGDRSELAFGFILRARQTFSLIENVSGRADISNYLYVSFRVDSQARRGGW